MKQILYILKHPDPFIIELIEHQQQEASVEVILTHDTVLPQIKNALPVFVLEANNNLYKRYPPISYKQMLEKIFRADTIVTV
ncbi:MAG: hypothetical protein AAB317_00135 [Nitrospirota bacterium]